MIRELFDTLEMRKDHRRIVARLVRIIRATWRSEGHPELVQRLRRGWFEGKRSTRRGTQ